MLNLSQRRRLNERDLEALCFAPDPDVGAHGHAHARPHGRDRCSHGHPDRLPDTVPHRGEAWLTERGAEIRRQILTSLAMNRSPQHRPRPTPPRRRRSSQRRYAL
jgi:hypothetical protein